MGLKVKNLITIMMMLLMACLTTFCSGGGGGNSGNNGGNGGGQDILSSTVSLARVKMETNLPDGSNLTLGYVNVTFLKNLMGGKIINLGIDLNGDGVIADYVIDGNTQQEWIVQNMPARVDIAEPNRYNFAFFDKNADSKTNLKGTAVLTDAPIPDTDWHGTVPAVVVASMNFTVASIGQETRLFSMSGSGSSRGGGLPFSMIPSLVSFPPTQDYSPAVAEGATTFSAFNSEVPDYRQGPMECGPTSATDNLVWLAKKGGFSNKLPANYRDTIEELKTDMNWALAGGVADAKFIPGKNKFCTDHNLPIETHQVGGFQDKSVIYKIKQEMDKGQGIELGMSFHLWDGSTWQAKGGHWVAVVGVKKDATGTYVDFHDPDTPTLLDIYKVRDTNPSYLSLPTYNPPYFTIIDLVMAQSPTVPPPPPNVPCPPLEDVLIPMITTNIYDPSSHLSHTGNPINNKTLHFKTTSSIGDITITGVAPFVTVTGVVSSQCSFIATGEGMVAGYPNVTVTMDGDFASGTITGEYTMGAGGELPGGNSIIFYYSGTP